MKKKKIFCVNFFSDRFRFVACKQHQAEHWNQAVWNLYIQLSSGVKQVKVKAYSFSIKRGHQDKRQEPDRVLVTRKTVALVHKHFTTILRWILQACKQDGIVSVYITFPLHYPCDATAAGDFALVFLCFQKKASCAANLLLILCSCSDPTNDAFCLSFSVGGRHLARNSTQNRNLARNIFLVATLVHKE